MQAQCRSLLLPEIPRATSTRFGMNKNTTTNWSKWSLVEVKGTLEVFPGRDLRVEGRLPKEIKSQFGLWQE